MGVLTIFYAPVAVDPLSLTAVLYWPVAGLFGVLLLAVFDRARRDRVGAEPALGPAAVVGCAVLGVVILPLSLTSPFPLIGLAILVMAARRRDVYLAGWGLLFGVTGTLAQSFVFDNALYGIAYRAGWFRATYGYFVAAPAIDFVTLGLCTLIAAWFARRRALRADA